VTVSLGNIKRMEDAGAAALVLHSLFEEHVGPDSNQYYDTLISGIGSVAESLASFPERSDLTIDPEAYLNEIVAAKEAVAIPVIASLNGSTLGGWIDYAKRSNRQVRTHSS
jgi:dihydroorotate dehydrogenase (fumarate)